MTAGPVWVEPTTKPPVSSSPPTLQLTQEAVVHNVTIMPTEEEEEVEEEVPSQDKDLDPPPSSSSDVALEEEKTDVKLATVTTAMTKMAETWESAGDATVMVVREREPAVVKAVEEEDELPFPDEELVSSSLSSSSDGLEEESADVAMATVTTPRAWVSSEDIAPLEVESEEPDFAEVPEEEKRPSRDKEFASEDIVPMAAGNEEPSVKEVIEEEEEEEPPSWNEESTSSSSDKREEEIANHAMMTTSTVMSTPTWTSSEDVAVMPIGVEVIEEGGGEEAPAVVAAEEDEERQRWDANFTLMSSSSDNSADNQEGGGDIVMTTTKTSRARSNDVAVTEIGAEEMTPVEAVVQKDKMTTPKMSLASPLNVTGIKVGAEEAPTNVVTDAKMMKGTATGAADGERDGGSPPDGEDLAETKEEDDEEKQELGDFRVGAEEGGVVMAEEATSADEKYPAETSAGTEDGESPQERKDHLEAEEEEDDVTTMASTVSGKGQRQPPRVHGGRGAGGLRGGLRRRYSNRSS